MDRLGNWSSPAPGTGGSEPDSGPLHPVYDCGLGTTWRKLRGTRTRASRALRSCRSGPVEVFTQKGENHMTRTCRKFFRHLPSPSPRAPHTGSNPVSQHQRPPGHLPGQSRAVSGPNPLISLHFTAGHAWACQRHRADGQHQHRNGKVLRWRVFFGV